MTPQRDSEAKIIALVTSAGGLEALSCVLRALPADLPAGVVVGQHLSAKGSALAEILQRRCKLKVAWATEGAALVPGQVLVCPPGAFLEVLPDDTCALLPNQERASARPLDRLLLSLAESCGRRALAVVLTGMGSDGAAGSLAVKRAGGVVLAQSEDSAEEPAMPRAAARNGAADLVLSLHEIAPVLLTAISGRPLPRPRGEAEAAGSLFGGPGEIRERLRALDWSATPLGPVSAWPGGLRVTVRITLDASCPMAVWWGPELVQLYNEEWRRFLGAARHPEALAGRAEESWSESWSAIGPLVERVLSRGEAVSAEDLPIHVLLQGGPEEVFGTFAYAPIRDDAGAVVGVHCTGWDTTQRVVADRRVATLRALGAQVAGAPTAREAAELAAAALASDPADVPFALIYLLDDQQRKATLAGAAGLEPGSFAAPRLVDVAGERGHPAWPLSRALAQASGAAGSVKGGGLLLEDLGERFHGLSPAQGAAPGAPPPRSASLLPLRTAADEPPLGILILGLSPQRPLDEGHRSFLDLIAVQIALALAQGKARERERERLEHLAELDRQKTEFFSNISHEFRTPLTLLLAPLEEALRQRQALPGPLAEDLDVAARNARRLLGLVDTLLDFSQSEAGRLRARFEPVDLAALTRDIASLFQSAAERAGLRLYLRCEPLPAPVWVDRGMWEKIVSNLLSNALKFTFEGGIVVELGAQAHHAELVVRDSGVGIPKDELPHIFKRFHRVRGARARTQEGAGIGLALVDELVRRHHGRTRVRSEEGRGTIFTIWVPLGPRPGDDGRGAEEPQASPAAAPIAAALAAQAAGWDGAGEGPLPVEGSGVPEGVVDEPLGPPGPALPARVPGARILIVDDNSDMRAYLRRLLAPRWQVEAVGDGAAALAAARQERPDLVLADVMMPNMDGFELLRRLRADEALAGTPLILVTARAGEEAAIAGLLAGADDYVAKPFSARELVARVGAQLELSRLRRRAEELNAFLIRFSDAVRGLRDPRAVAIAACRMVREHLGAERAYWAEIGGTSGEYVIGAKSSFEPEAPVIEGRFPLQEWEPLTSSLRAGRTVATDDAQADLRLTPRLKHHRASLDIGANLAAPVLADGELRSAFIVSQRQPRRWTPEEIALVEGVAGRCWAEVERARAEAALRDREARLAGIKEAFQAAVSGAPLEESLRVLIRTAVEQAGSGVRGAFYLADHARSELRHVFGMPDDYADCVDGFRIGADSLACGLAVHTGRAVITPDVAEAPEWRPWLWLAQKYDYRAVWSFPVETTEGSVIGALALYFPSPRDATPRDRELAAVLTQAAAILISRAQGAEERARAEAAVRESERRYRELLPRGA